MDARATSISEVQLLALPKIENRAGNITAIDQLKEVPFNIERVYYLYDIPGGQDRGGHAHRNLYQLLVAASGSFSVELFDGTDRKTYHLNRPYQGLLIKPGLWRELKDFSSGAICLVVADMAYDERDYIRDFMEFKQWKCK